VSDRAEHVRKIRAEHELRKAEILAAKKLVDKNVANEVRAPKTGCNFCSHYRRKILNGVAAIKKVLVGDI